MAFIDCTEQPIPRPKSRIRSRLYYSGKRKKHTVKNLYVANQKDLIIFKTKRRWRVRKHDYKVYNNNHPDIPNEVLNMFDLRFFGIETDYTEQRSSLPIKKEKDCELSAEEKDIQKSFQKKDSYRTCNL